MNTVAIFGNGVEFVVPSGGGDRYTRRRQFVLSFLSACHCVCVPHCVGETVSERTVGLFASCALV
jgi:hypothetical protein